MKEITVLSGKGGAGKTTVAAALASVAEKAVFCDNDVDAADLHLIFQPEIKESYTFSSGKKAAIKVEKCTNCGLCQEKCRFDAIHPSTNRQIPLRQAYNPVLNKGQRELPAVNTTPAPILEINPYQCEGCRLCERICPENAIAVTENNNNHWYVSNTRFGILVHAQMGPGEENSGRLVTRVREKTKDIALKTGADFIVGDGPPGIGCAAISSVTGTDLVLLVIEPTLSGIHDAKRLAELVGNFNVPILAVINKFDLNPEISEDAIRFLSKKGIRLIGKINFEKNAVESMIAGQSVVEFAPESIFSKEVRHIWDEIKEQFET